MNRKALHRKNSAEKHDFFYVCANNCCLCCSYPLCSSCGALPTKKKKKKMCLRTQNKMANNCLASERGKKMNLEHPVKNPVSSHREWYQCRELLPHSALHHTVVTIRLIRLADTLTLFRLWSNSKWRFVSKQRNRAVHRMSLWNILSRLFSKLLKHSAKWIVSYNHSVKYFHFLYLLTCTFHSTGIDDSERGNVYTKWWKTQ